MLNDSTHDMARSVARFSMCISIGVEAAASAAEASIRVLACDVRRLRRTGFPAGLSGSCRGAPQIVRRMNHTEDAGYPIVSLFQRGVAIDSCQALQKPYKKTIC